MEQRIKTALLYIGGTALFLFGVYVLITPGLIPLVDPSELPWPERTVNFPAFVSFLGLAAGAGAIYLAFTNESHQLADDESYHEERRSNCAQVPLDTHEKDREA